MKRIIVKGMLLVGLAAQLLTGCGGGGSASPVAGGTTTTTGTVAKSTTTGVTVNHVDFATGGATVTIDGEPATASDLKPGMHVTITGSHDGTKGAATHVEREGELEGKVSAVDTAAGSFIVMGQTVVVTAQTVFDGISGLSSLNVGDEVEVDGVTSASGVIEATRVEVEHVQGKKSKFITGVVANIDPAAKTFTIRNVTVDYASAVLPSSSLADGQAVLVKGALKNGVFVATKIVISGTMSPTPAPNPTPAPLDGAALYSANCASCHGGLATSSKKGRSATQIQAAITGNKGGMGSITLTAAEIAAIATALSGTSTPPPATTPVAISTTSLAAATVGTAYSQSLTATGGTAPYVWTVTGGSLPAGLTLAAGLISGTPTTAGTATVTITATDAATPAATAAKGFSLVVSAAASALDGAALYAANCASCHGPLATSSKRTRSATQIQTAITGNKGGMGSIKLTAAEVAAIATVLK